MATRYRQDAHQSLEQYKGLSDQLAKLEERLRGMADKAQALEKENSSLRSQVSKGQSELHAKEAVIDRLEQQCRDLTKLRDSGKDLVKQEVEKMEEEIRKERKEHEKSLKEALAKVKEFEGQLSRVRSEALELR